MSTMRPVVGLNAVSLAVNWSAALAAALLVAVRIAARKSAFVRMTSLMKGEELRPAVRL